MIKPCSNIGYGLTQNNLAVGRVTKAQNIKNFLVLTAQQTCIETNKVNQLGQKSTKISLFL